MSNSESTPLGIITHDGYRGNEKPRAVLSGDKTFLVEEIEDAWISTGVSEQSPVCRGFIVRCENDMRFRAIHTDLQGWQVTQLFIR